MCQEILRGGSAYVKVLNEVIVEQNLDHGHEADTTLLGVK
jgi:hypothetical protein